MILRGITVQSAIEYAWEPPTNKKLPATGLYSRVIHSERVQQPRDIKCRASSFPLCSVLLLDNLLGAERNEDFVGNANMSMGTGLHEAMHEWVMSQDSQYRPLGDWYCRSCKKTREFTTESECPDCGEQCRYEELEVKYKQAQGHIDCVLYDEKTKRVSIVDYKTTSDYGAKSKGMKDFRWKYTYQLHAYTFMFMKQYGDRLPKGTKMGSASLLFVSRNSVRVFKEYSWPMMFSMEAGKQIVEEQLKAWKAAHKALKTGTFQHAYKDRICTSPQQYDDLIEPMFWGGCPLANICVNAGDSKALRQRMKKRLKKNGKA